MVLNSPVHLSVTPLASFPLPLLIPIWFRGQYSPELTCTGTVSCTEHLTNYFNIALWKLRRLIVIFQTISVREKHDVFKTDYKIWVDCMTEISFQPSFLLTHAGVKRMKQTKPNL